MLGRLGRPGIEEVAVAAGADRPARAVVVQRQDVSGDPVEECPVVRDDHDGATLTLDQPLDQLGGVGVEMVGWLVKQQHVWSAGEQPGQPGPGLLAARQFRERCVPAPTECIRPDREALHRRGEVVDRLVAAEAVEGRHRRLVGDQRLVGVVALVAERGRRLLDSQRGRGEAARGDVDQAGQCSRGLVRESLAQVADPGVRSEGDRTARWLAVAGEQGQERGFARAVRPDDTEDLAGVEREGEILEDDALVDVCGQGMDSQHNVFARREAQRRERDRPWKVSHASSLR